MPWLKWIHVIKRGHRVYRNWLEERKDTEISNFETHIDLIQKIVGKCVILHANTICMLFVDWKIIISGIFLCSGQNKDIGDHHALDLICAEYSRISTRGRLNINMPHYQYADKTVSRPSYLYIVNPNARVRLNIKMSSYQNRIPIIKIRQSRLSYLYKGKPRPGQTVFILRRPCLRDGLHIETGHWMFNSRRVVTSWEMYSFWIIWSSKNIWNR